MNPAAPMTNKIINNKQTKQKATNKKLREETWQTLTNEFNSSVTSFSLTPSQLRLKWENFKKSARKRCANMRSSHNKTGGGKDYFPTNEVLDNVTSLLGNNCQGFSVEFGGEFTNKTDLNLVMSEVDMNIEGHVVLNVSQVLKEIQILETPPPKH